VILVLGLVLTAPADARAEDGASDLLGFGGREVAADFIRLAGYGTGPILAAGPGLDVAAGRAGAHALGQAGCDDQRMTYRELTHPRVSLDVDSEGARRLDLILRSVNEAREVTFTLDGDPIGTAFLTGKWQRVSLRIQALTPGAHRLSLTMSPTGTRLSGDLASEVLALLHSVRLSTRVQTPGGDPVDTFAGDGALWLEPGETLRVPAIGLADHALQTAGLLVRGDPATLSINAAIETADGAIAPLLSTSAALDLPWNLALDPGGSLAPGIIRVAVAGEHEGAVALRHPLLTLPATPRSDVDADPEVPRLVLVVIPGLRSDEGAAGLGQLPGVQVRHVWSTAEASAPALGSLLTGHYAEAHGLIKRSDSLASNVTTLARAALRAGHQTILRAGRVPHARDKRLWAGHGDAKFAASGEFSHTAEHVLKATLEALEGAGPGPVFATVALGDVRAPYLPRADAWTAHWQSEPGSGPKGGSRTAPWDALDGRKELQRQRASGKTPTEVQRAYWRALRRGKVDEVLAALGPFLAATKDLPDGPIRVAIVGLAGHDPLADGTLPDLRSLVAPLALDAGLAAVSASGPADLTDVHATLRVLAGLPLGSGPGHRLDAMEGSRWTDAAHATIANRWDVMVTPAVSLLSDRMADAVSWLVSEGASPASSSPLPSSSWTAREAATGGPALIENTLLLRRFTARGGAGARWTRAAYGVAAAPDRPAGTGGLCGR